jgi:MYXO-CTERM domain-containing protein
VTTDVARARTFACDSDQDCWGFGVCGENGYCRCNSDEDCPGGYSCQADSAGTFCEAVPLDNLTYRGGCGAGAGGGRVLETPEDGSNVRVKEWIDFVEDFCSSGDEPGGRPRNPELRADGRTPLAPAIHAAHDAWYAPILDEASDPIVNCRPYSFVVITDGMDTCSRSDPATEIERLFSANEENPVKTYVIGIGSVDRCSSDDDCVTTCNTALGVCNCLRDDHCTGACNVSAGNVCSSLDLEELNKMSMAGGTGPEALLATTPEDVEEALADIMNETTRDACNGVDDNCNGLIDESERVYQTCFADDECSSSNCDAGRCRCTVGSIDECAGGFVCAKDGFCRPTCSAGQGSCARAGVQKCGAPIGKCCSDDGSDECTLLEALPGADDDCQIRSDECQEGQASCEPGYNCVAGECAALCGGGEFPCPGGTECRDGHCLKTPTSLLAEGVEEPVDEWEPSSVAPPPREGCGCRVPGGGSTPTRALFLTALVGGLVARRRRYY